MLVLTRKYQEKIRIGNDITITVLRTKGKAVRLGIEAPSNVPVIRGELKFEEQADASAPMDIEATAGAAATTRESRRSRELSVESSWVTKSRPQSAARRRVGSAPAEVAHSRVPRDKVSELVPRLVSGNAPLRSLVEQRGTTV